MTDLRVRDGAGRRRRPGVATLTLNRPDAMNAFDHTMDREFHEAMWALDADDAVRVIVVTGAGRAFCAAST